MIEPRQTPITPYRRVRNIERATLLRLAITTCPVCSLRTPAPLRRTEITTETAATTAHTAKTTSSDIGAFKDFPTETLRIQGPVNTRSVQMGTVMARTSHKEAKKTRRTHATSPRAIASPYAGQRG